MSAGYLPSLDVLQAFTVFAETRNFSETARRLHLSQPALHTKIAGLAERLGLTLYVRRGAGVELTRQGLELAQFARSIIDRARGGLESIRKSESAEQVVLAAGAGAYLYLLGPPISGFRGRSEALLKLITANQAEAVNSVRTGIADIAVAPLVDPTAGLERRELLQFGQCLVLPRGHPLSVRKKLKMSDVRGLPLILPPRGRPHRERIASLIQDDEGGINVVAEADGWHLMMKFVSLGIGSAIVNDYCELPKGLLAIPIVDVPKEKLFVVRSERYSRSNVAAAMLWDEILRGMKARYER